MRSLPQVATDGFDDATAYGPTIAMPRSNTSLPPRKLLKPLTAEDVQAELRQATMREEAQRAAEAPAKGDNHTKRAAHEETAAEMHLC